MDKDNIAKLGLTTEELAELEKQRRAARQAGDFLLEVSRGDGGGMADGFVEKELIKIVERHCPQDGASRVYQLLTHKTSWRPIGGGSKLAVLRLTLPELAFLLGSSDPGRQMLEWDAAAHLLRHRGGIEGTETVDALVERVRREVAPYFTGCAQDDASIDDASALGMLAAREVRDTPMGDFVHNSLPNSNWIPPAASACLLIGLEEEAMHHLKAAILVNTDDHREMVDQHIADGVETVSVDVLMYLQENAPVGLRTYLFSKYARVSAIPMPELRRLIDEGVPGEFMRLTPRQSDGIARFRKDRLDRGDFSDEPIAIPVDPRRGGQ